MTKSKRSTIEKQLLATAIEEDETTKKINYIIETIFERQHTEGHNLISHFNNKERCIHGLGSNWLSPIQIIDGILVNAFLIFGLVEIGINITSCVLVEDEDNKNYYTSFFKRFGRDKDGKMEFLDRLTTEKNIRKYKQYLFTGLCEFLRIIPTLKFNKFEGKFCKTNHFYIDDLFKFNNTTISECDECVVCYEKTKSRTPCGHYLCYKCNENIDTNLDLDDNPERPCPVCRKDIIYIN